jgi:hypothetical protein
MIAEAMVSQEVDAFGLSNSNGGSTLGFTNGFVQLGRRDGKRSDK